MDLGERYLPVTELTDENGAVPEDRHPESVEIFHSEAQSVPVETAETTAAPAGKKSRAGLIALVAVVIVGLLGYFFVSRSHTSAGDLEKMQGNVALSEQQLHDVVVNNHLTVFWAGPQAGAKYSLNATNLARIFVKYLPGGVGINDTKTPFRTVGTYVQKSAYQVATYTGTLSGNVGTVNGDGNAIFYSSARDTNVYVGVKGKDIQVEVYDPVSGQALGLVLTNNLVRQIV